jgi:hypothetical protein
MLAGCDYVISGGQYTNNVLQVLTAIKHALV